MASKPDISTKVLLPWDEYKDKEPSAALASIYSRTAANSIAMCTWYWTSVGTKRWTSLWIRALSFVLLAAGTSLPIFAAIQDLPKDKLIFTQWAVAMLALSGLLLLADRVFGWSSGWTRYITTVTTMENLTRSFELEWAKYILSKTASLDSNDVKSLFELARALEQELTKLQADETGKWVAEFNTGTSLLETTIKTQREETDKKIDAIRTTLSTQETAQKADDKSRLPGAIEVTLTHKSEPKPIRIWLDSESSTEFTGLVWSKLHVPLGQHIISIQTTAEPIQKIERVVEVKPAEVARLEIKFTS